MSKIDINNTISSLGAEKNKVIPILQEIQKAYNYLPQEALTEVCEKSDISASQITGVATFYNQFRLAPAGKHLIKVCVGTACHVKGAMQVYDAFQRHLKLSDKEDTDQERNFTLEKVSCLGCCTLAPVIQIDDVTFGKVKQNEIPQIIDNFLVNQKSQLKFAPKRNKQLISQGEVRIGLGSCCVASGSEKIREALHLALVETGIQTQVKQVGCVGMCHQVPLLEIVSGNNPPLLYSKVSPDEVKNILLKHFKPQSFFQKLKNTINQTLETLYYPESPVLLGGNLLDMKEKHVDDFMNQQIHIATENKGVLNPSDIEEYKSNHGFMALRKAILSLSQEQVINEVLKSGIRGRGGAGFLTGKKWETVFNTKSEHKYVICNGDEGDPGAFMDRMLLESFPYRIIEGMSIAARAVGASQGFMYIRAEYPLAVTRIKNALDVCRKNSMLGNNILGSDFCFDIEVFEGAGAFVCGEETALIESMEGERGMPRIRPPFPATSGLNSLPTLINNVETLATIPWIIRNGAEAFNKIGTESSKGTKVFSLAGKVVRGGLIEVPMGITISDIVDGIGGGVVGHKKFKAVQIGGPSGGCIPENLSHTPVDFHYLNEVGAMMGSGGLVVLDNNDCVVDIARYFLSFTQNQSCGKCVFCRIGTKHMLNILDKLCTGKGEPNDIQLLEDLCEKVKIGSLCGLGKTAPNPVLTSLKYFRKEYQAHIDKKCPAKKCKDLISYSVNNKCIGCTKCAQDCPVQAIEFKPYQIHSIDKEKCIKCDICKQVCSFDAIDVD